MVGLAHGNAENQRVRETWSNRSCRVCLTVETLEEHVSREACRSLAYLLRTIWKIKRLLHRLEVGGCSQAKETHRDVENVQEWAIKCLGILASDATAILASMRCFKNNASVQQWGCNALGHLAHVTSNGCDDIVNLHGVDTILSAMKHHEKDVWISLAGCETIWMLVYQHSSTNNS